MSDQNPSKVVTIDACKVVDRARELLAKPGAAYFFDGAVGVIAHEFAEHSASLGFSLSRSTT